MRDEQGLGLPLFQSLTPPLPPVVSLHSRSVEHFTRADFITFSSLVECQIDIKSIN